ncbi:MAG: sugar phosphate isomerase/epimerase [Pirellulaceae bacterium]
MRNPSRREFLAAGAAIGASAAFAAHLPAADDKQDRGIGLGFSLYGMRSLDTGDALKTCAEIGYDCVELPVMVDWPWDSATLSKPQRREIRGQLDERGLRLSAVMENLPAVVDDARHRANLDRLKAAAEAAHDVSPDGGHIIETVLGGRPAQWEQTREAMAKRVADWAKVGEETKTVIAVKAHVGGAMHLPEHPVWLIEQIDSPWLRGAYDFSHFTLREVDMNESIRTLVPQSVFIHVKDRQGDASKFQFLLPGEGDTDYVALLKGVAAAGYRGDVVVEVSGQIHNKPGYDAKAAARKSYKPLAAAFHTAGISRH